MAQRLDDVLHHFDPAFRRSKLPASGIGPVGAAPPRPGRSRVLGVPLCPGDLLRSAALWALAVEVARRDGTAALLCPASGDEPDPWPADPEASPGVRLHRLGPGPTPERLAAEALRLAEADAERGARLAFLGLPRGVFEDAFGGGLERALLFVRPDRPGRRQAEADVRRLLQRHPTARIGIVVQGARTLAEAREAFEDLGERVERGCGRLLRSYGLLVDDLALYRAVLDRRAVGITRPQSPAARALADVARLLLEDLEDPEA